jgi:hypothetical protein
MEQIRNGGEDWGVRVPLVQFVALVSIGRKAQCGGYIFLPHFLFFS